MSRLRSAAHSVLQIAGLACFPAAAWAAHHIWLVWLAGGGCLIVWAALIRPDGEHTAPR